MNTVTLEIPARPDHVVLARLMAAAVGSRAELNVEEIDDLRLAVGEVCTWLMDGDRGGRLTLTFNSDGGRIKVTCLHTSDPEVEQAPPSFESDSLSATIVQALADECGTVSEDGTPGVWFVKLRDEATR